MTPGTITEVLKAEQFQALLEAAPDAMVITDSEGTILLVNAQCERLFGFSRDELAGSPVEVLLPLGKRHTHVSNRKRYKDKPRVRPMGSGLDLVGRTKEGRLIPVEVSLSPFQTEGGILVTAAIRDVTQRKIAEQKSRELLREQEARVVAEEARERLTFLAEASEVLASSLSHEQTVSHIANLVVPKLADWCTVHVVRDDGNLVPLVAAHADPDRQATVELLRLFPAPEDAPGTVAHAARSGAPFLAERIDDRALRKMARDEDHLTVLRGVGLTSLLHAPMTARGRTLGVLTMAYAESGRHYTTDDLSLAVDLSRRAAQAIDNSMLYERAQVEIAERREVEQALRRSEAELATEKERLAVTLLSIREGVIATTTDGRVVLINPAAEALTGCARDDAMGRPVREVLRFEPDGGEGASARAPARTGPVVTGLLRARDGSERRISASEATILNGQRDPLGMVHVFRDVTRDEQIEAELLRASKLESLGVLAGGIAHDFNNIMTTVLANISLLRAQPDDPDLCRKRLEEAERAALRARGLTQQLLTYAKGGVPVRRPTRLADLIFDATRFALAGSNVRPTFDLDSDLPLVHVDPSQLSQVVQEIVLNAQQAMPDGGGLRVLSHAQDVDGSLPLPLPPGRYVRLTFEDEGPGIPEHVLPRIFDPFFSTRPGGSGLGLTTAWSIVQKHDGLLLATSREARGALFELFLPALTTAAPEPRVAPERTPSGVRKVLVMDDDAMMLTTVRELLRVLGYEAEVAPDGERATALYREALERKSPFDAVILDLTVPDGLGGKETIALMREIDPDVCAIVSSGYSDDPVMAHFERWGFSGVLPKPYSLREIREVLATLLS